ncbi:MAG TPA: hypothetical protein VL977_05235 [Solirubrobacteraceae bacterium]|nr:hypothetical protein [Solirubrobacteraceae bacterium]
MLAYVFWHRAGPDVAPDAYEAALARFHDRLRSSPPGGFVGSATLRAARLPWLAGGGPGYEDWYVIEDYAALGVINAAAVAPANERAHRAAASLMGEGTGGVYQLLDGRPSFAEVTEATWIAPAPGPFSALLDDFLADGIDRDRASLWRRQLALGPAPELCLLAGERSAGTRPTRLASGWSERTDSRSPI